MPHRSPYIMIGLIAGLLINSVVAMAWSGPPASAPTCPGGSLGCSAPVNVGTQAQVKNGDLGINFLTTFGDVRLVGGWAPTPSTITYLNFSNAQYPTPPTWGSLGYGIRDNNGTLEFKNSGGSWSSIQSTVNTLLGATGQWSTSGSSIYYNGGNVGIGELSPATRLQVGNGGDGYANGLTIRSNYPTIYLRDVDGRGAMIHNNSNILYFISSGDITGVANVGNNWVSQANGYWPLYLNLNTNDAVFGGNVYAFGYFHNSDARLKKDIIPIENGLEIVKKLTGVSYKWKANDRQALGVIAQDVAKVLPSAVREDKEGTKSVEYDQLIAPMIEAIKEQQSEIDSLKHEIEILKQIH
jgi:hypothetical protein